MDTQRRISHIRHKIGRIGIDDDCELAALDSVVGGLHFCNLFFEWSAFLLLTKWLKQAFTVCVTANAHMKSAMVNELADFCLAFCNLRDENARVSQESMNVN